MKALLIVLLLGLSLPGLAQKKISLGSGGTPATGKKSLRSGGVPAPGKKSLPRNFTLVYSSPTYSVPVASRTSAGIFKGDQLIRTLWSNEPRASGTYSLSSVWDGLDDEGNSVPDTTYQFKLVSGNPLYEWLRPVGNTSDSTSGNSVHHSQQIYTGMVQVGTDMYLANGYNEVGDSHLKFAIGAPGKLTTTLRGGAAVPRFIVSDGNRVYYATQNRGPNSFIMAITPNPGGVDALYPFSTGRQIRISGNNDYQYSGVDYDSLRNFGTGLAVQKTGNKLLVAHALSNEVRVLNKLTGAYQSTNAIPDARNIALQDDNTLWVSRMTSHTGTTTASKITGTQIGSEAAGNNPMANAFDANSSTYFRTTGGAFNFVGIKTDSRTTYTQVRIKAAAGNSLTCQILGYDGWEQVLLGTITSTSGTWATVNLSSTTPFRQIVLDNHDGPAMFIDEVEFYGYSSNSVPVVSKHTLASDGTISAPTLTLPGIIEPVAVGISFDGAKISVSDRGGVGHQVKIFDTGTGSLLSTIGRAESYDNPTVYNDKFYFFNTKIFRDDDYGMAHAFLAYQSDGSLWIGDYGNSRVQHFAANGAYIDNILHVGYSYNTQADYNDPKRVFSSFLEYEVDYSDNSWKFVRNWNKTVKNPFEFEEERFRSVVTLSNNRTYALFASTNSGPREVLELNNTTGVRHTGVFMDAAGYNAELTSDGAQWQRTDAALGTQVLYKRRALTGFDGSNNPLWGAYTTLTTTPPVVATDPISGPFRGNPLSSTGVIVTFNADNGKGASSRGLGYHLGGLKNGQWLFKTSKATRFEYVGDYPADGAFDIGNNVNFAGSFMQVVDRHVFWGYKGEFWKSRQTNMYTHYLDNGLMVGQFGTTGDISSTYGQAAPMMAGNATTGTYVKVGSDIHLFHPDESHHAAIHHWKISNLSSIQEQSISVTKISTTAPPVVDYVNLMQSVPFSGSIASSIGRWGFSPLPDSSWKVDAGLIVYRPVDRSLRFTSLPKVNGLTREAYCDLSVAPGQTNNLSNWTLSGKLTYPVLGELWDNFADIIDNTGKVIVRFSRPQNSNGTVSIKANSTSILTSSGNALNRIITHPQDLRISRSGSNILVNYAGYPEVSVSVLDAGANLDSPASLRVRLYSADNRGHQIELTNLRFYAN